MIGRKLTFAIKCDHPKCEFLFEGEENQLQNEVIAGAEKEGWLCEEGRQICPFHRPLDSEGVFRKCPECGHSVSWHKKDGKCNYSRESGGGDSGKLRTIEFCDCVVNVD